FQEQRNQCNYGRASNGWRILQYFAPSHFEDFYQSKVILHTLSLFLEQFVLDVQFLVEIGMDGGYFSNNLLRLLTHEINLLVQPDLTGLNSDDCSIDMLLINNSKAVEIEIWIHQTQH
ncbi:hypothetical protein A2U01_0015719, partial [Trifolium medium]|nr:hypothetical protein [Trifolium medium]